MGLTIRNNYQLTVKISESEEQHVREEAAEGPAAQATPDALNLASDTFDPLSVLYSTDWRASKKEPKVKYDNLAAFENALRKGGLWSLNKKPKKAKPATTEETPSTSSEVNSRRFQPHQMPIAGNRNIRPRHQRSIFSQMASAAGPTAELQKWVTERKRIRVVVRKESGVRGYLEGVLLLFDKYWNLVLKDVTEVIRRRKPKYSVNKMCGEPTDCSEHLRRLGIDLNSFATSVKSLNRKNVQVERRLPCVMLRGEQVVVVSAARGAIFSSRNTTAEWAFKYAIHRINSDKSMLPNTNLLFNIQYVDEFNSFDACKKACDQIGHGVQVIFGPSNENLGSHIHSICDALDIPYIDIHIDKYQENRDVAINIYPTQDHVNRAFLDVIQYLNWTKLGILYEKDFGILELRDMMRSTTLEIHVRQVDPGNYIDVLQELKNHEVYNIIIDTDSTKIAIILKGILQLQMNEYKYHFLFTSFDIETFDLEDFKYNMVNITSFRLVDFTDVGVKRTIKDIETFINRNRPGLDFESQMMNTEAALIYDAVYVFTIGLQNLEQSHSLQSSNVSCSVEIPYDAGLSLINYINSVEWKGLTGATQFKEGHRIQFKLDLVKLKQHSIVKVGEWSPSTGLNITNPLLFFDAGSMNLTLVVITILETPYVMMHLGKNFTGNSRFFGFCVDILERIAHEVGFDYILDLVPDRKYGAKDPVTGEWNGMVAQLMKYKADLAVGSMTITYARESVIDFTKPFMNLGISILFKVPSTPSTRLFSFMNPLGFEVWIYVIAAYFLVSMTLYYTAKFLPQEWRDAHPCDVNNVVKTNQLTIANSFWFAIITLMQQGSDVYPKSISTRIISSIWWFFTLIIVASYTANLAAFLTVERMTTPIENAEDLASQTEISYGTLESGSTMTFFRDSMIETYKKMWRNMENKKKTSFTSTYEEGINRVNQGSYAFLMESTMLDYIVQRNCNYTQIGGLLDTKGYGIATPKGSPWRDKISLAILELQEKGDIQMLYDKWWKSDSETCVRNHNNKQSKANALGLDNIGGVFVVLLVGVGFAICVSIFEFCQYYRQEGMNQQSFPDENTLPGEDGKESQEKESSGQPIQHATAVPRQSLCMAMFEEFKKALSCTDSRRRPVLKRYCSKCCVVYQKNPAPKADQ